MKSDNGPPSGYSWQVAKRRSSFRGYTRDVESAGRPQQDHKYRFRDNAELEPDDQRRVEFKKKLLDSVENADSKMERFRKSDEEVCFLFIFTKFSMLMILHSSNVSRTRKSDNSTSCRTNDLTTG
jgi:hypothetical protein